MENVFIKLILDGRIHDLDGLKKAYWKLAKKTHPDSAGSDKYIRKFIQIKSDFEKAKQLIISNSFIPNEKNKTEIENFRYLFFREMQKLYFLDSSFFRKKGKIKTANETAFGFFKDWKMDSIELYKSACLEYEKIKKEKMLFQT
jgi:curved DNA-binding protein CbpA